METTASELLLRLRDSQKSEAEGAKVALSEQTQSQLERETQ